MSTRHFLVFSGIRRLTRSGKNRKKNCEDELVAGIVIFTFNQTIQWGPKMIMNTNLFDDFTSFYFLDSTGFTLSKHWTTPARTRFTRRSPTWPAAFTSTWTSSLRSRTSCSPFATEKSEMNLSGNLRKRSLLHLFLITFISYLLKRLLITEKTTQTCNLCM